MSAHQAGITCPRCGAATAKTYWTGHVGRQKIRLDCGSCGKVLRHLDPADVRYEPRPPDSHRQETAPPPAGWQWLGMIRQRDGVWRAVALAADLGRCWDCLLTFPGRGDLLCYPVRSVASGADREDET